MPHPDDLNKLHTGVVEEALAVLREASEREIGCTVRPIHVQCRYIWWVVGCADIVAGPPLARRGTGVAGYWLGFSYLQPAVRWCVVSYLVPGDEDLHYCDNSHRFVPPGKPDEQADALHATRVRIHLQAHRDNPNAGEDVWRRVMRGDRVN